MSTPGCHPAGIIFPLVLALERTVTRLPDKKAEAWLDLCRGY
jgi:hypothetical protein